MPSAPPHKPGKCSPRFTVTGGDSLTQTLGPSSGILKPGLERDPACLLGTQCLGLGMPQSWGKSVTIQKHRGSILQVVGTLTSTHPLQMAPFLSWRIMGWIVPFQEVMLKS